MSRCRFPIVLVLAWCGFGPLRPASAQLVNPAIADAVITYNVELNEAASSTRRDLERAEEFLKNQHWEEAIETLRRIVEEDSDRVLATDYGTAEPGPFAVYIPVRDYCQMRLARLAHEAPAALALYRQRVDPVARQWLEQARANRDPAPLRRLVQTMFASRYGDDALFLLGEIELERGRLAAARGAWERIAPSLRTPVERNPAFPTQPALPLWLALQGLDLEAHWNDLAPALERRGGPGAWFAYPDTDLNLAEVRARLALVSILEKSPERAAVEVELVARLHPDAQGTIGGRSGKLHEVLSALLEQSRQWDERPPPADWPTFAGNQERNRAAPQSIDVGRPLWVRPFDKTFESTGDIPDELPFLRRDEASDSGEQPSTPLLSYHPIVVGDVVLYNDWRRIYALRLRTGEPAWPLGVQQEPEGVIYDPSQPLPFGIDAVSGRRELGAARFSLNVHHERLVARMGTPVTAEPVGSLGGSVQQGFLASLDFESLKPLHVPIRPDGPQWAFEGTPVTDGVRLYVAERHSEIRAVAYVACYNMQTGQRLWRRKICSSETLGRGQRREKSHNLLTLAEGTLYYNTNLGAIAAISAPDGELQWVARYPRISHRRDDERQDPRFMRDMNPCVFHKGVVLAFPADCNQLFALDAMSGQFLWATPEESTPDVAHLLGVTADDNLVVGGACLYWVNAYSGRFLAVFPENGSFARGFELPNPHGAGRGVLAGDLIYWPTQTNTDAGSNTHVMKIQVFRQALRRSGRAWEVERARDEIDVSQRVPGVPLDRANLVVSNGVLLLATPRHLIAFGE